MITHEEALERIVRNVEALEAEEVVAAECAGRVLAADVTARLPSPPFDKSAMDGYAAREADLVDLPVELEVVGKSAAGEWPEFTVGPGQCSGIATGAPVPPGADTVVMVEHTEPAGEGCVRIGKLSARNICSRGEDITEGQRVLKSGERMTPLRVGVASSAGYGRLRVYRRPSVALLCTGTEVVEPPAAVRPGQIYNSNGPILSALLTPEAEELRYLGIAEDDPERLREALERGLESDLLVVAGGVSVGPYDLVPDTLRSLGVEVVFHGCAIKPGKPGLFGVHRRRGRKAYVYGLPGNPQSGFVIFHVLMRPILSLLAGGRPDALPPEYKTGVVRQGFTNKPARKNFIPCRAWSPEKDGRVYLEPARWRGSADIMGTSAANAFLTVPQGVKEVREGEVLEYFDIW